jgi:aspartate aminotransferase
VDGITIKSADDFARALLKKSLVAVVPCDGFAAPEYIRMAYAAHEDVIIEGLKRLDAFMRSL